MQIFAVLADHDGGVQVVAAEIVKETPLFYVREDFKLDDMRRNVFQNSKRIEKGFVNLTPRAALERYMAMRRRDRDIAKTIAGQVNKQIASANELLMHLPEEPPAADAVDPQATDPATPDHAR